MNRIIVFWIFSRIVFFWRIKVGEHLRTRLDLLESDSQEGSSRSDEAGIYRPRPERPFIFDSNDPVVTGSFDAESVFILISI